ncbi:MAG: hypothetical protein IKO34_10415 [Bacteroidales bacterium]|nr:hypothetical protein [Bacteroidales bacterium]
MKWILLFVMPLVMATNPKIDKDKCTCNGYPSYGRVQVVDCAPDLRVQIVDCAADLEVKVVDFPTNNCGTWQFVDCAPAIRVEFVDCAPDIRVKYVEYSPGIKK